MAVSFLRMSAFLDSTKLTMPVFIIGVGAIGSHVALTAAKMGFTNFVIFDDDKIEEYNLPNQAYDSSMVGLYKVDALQEVLTRFNPLITVTKYPRRFTADDAQMLSGYVISAVDSMIGRRMLLDAIELNPDVLLFLEARLGFDHGMINTLLPLDMKAIKSFRAGLKPDSEVPDGPCNQRICSTLVTIIAGALTHRMCEHAKASNEKPWLIDQYVTKTLFNLEGSLQTANP